MPLERSSYSTWAVSASCRDCENLGAQTDLDAGPGLGALPQDAFQIRLVKAVARVPALRTDFHRPGPMEQQPAAGVHEAHARRDMRVRKDGFTQPNRLQDAHNFIVELHRPGRGYAAPSRSSTRTGTPHRPSKLAKVAPAGPQPTMQTSYTWSSISVIAS